MLPTPVAQRARPINQTQPEHRPLVLVIDPDRSARSVLEVVLARDGFDVWSTDSAVEALKLTQGRVPDVVVLEAELGGDDGFMFCARLRGEITTATVPVVLLSKQADQGAAQQLAEVVGVDDVVEKPAFARDISALVRLELAKRDGGKVLQFSAAQLAPAHLLRAMLAGPRAGRMMLAEGRAEVLFRHGKVIDARFERLTGVEALVRALMLTQGRWTMTLEPVVGPPELHCSLRELVHEVFPRLSKWSAVLQRSVPLDARLQIDFSRLAQQLPTMPDEINRIVQLFDGFRTLRQVLLDSSYDETLTLEVATRLYLMGVVAPVAGSKVGDDEPRPAPRLFEPRPTEAEELMRELFNGAAEIRADLTPAAALVGEDDDWFEPVKGSGLEVGQADGGWHTAGLSEAAGKLLRPMSSFEPEEQAPLGDLAELAPELARQLDAFNIKTEIEPKQLSAEEQPLAGFARGDDEDDDDEVSGSLEAAMREATGDAGATVTEPLPLTRRAEDQGRIITPPLTPAVEVTAAADLVVAPLLQASLQPALGFASDHASLPVEPTELTPPFARMLSVPDDMVLGASVEPPTDEPLFDAKRDDVEAAFFDTMTPSLEEAEQAFTSRRRTILMYSGILAAVLLLAVVVEVVVIEAQEAAPVPAPVVLAPVLKPPEPAPEPVVEAAPIVEEEAPAIDVTEPLADARTQYEAGQYRKAIATLEQVITDAPDSVPAWLLLGLAHFDANEDAAAKTAVEKVLELDPKNARGYILQSALLTDYGDKVGAKAALEKAVEVDPSGPFAEEAQALLRRP